MHETQDYMNVEFPSRSENVAFARVTVAAFAARLPFTIAELEELKVAVSEAVTNAVVHGYPKQVGRIRIEAKVEETSIMVTIIDYGRGMVDSSGDDEQEEREQCTGMGFVFMESFSDAVRVESPSGGGTIVHLTKRPDHRVKANE